MSEKLEYVIGLLVDANSIPDAHTPEQHIERATEVYRLLHLASETLVLEVIPEAQLEGDFFKRTGG